MMLAAKFTGQPVAGWWLSEKFDGVRCFWDGEALRTRTWRAIAAPWWFVQAMPSGVALDGELWAGRGGFQTVSEFARLERADDPAWQSVTFQAFDWPTCDAVPFEERLANLAPYANGVVQVVGVRQVKGAADALAAMRAIVAGGGEGCVLKAPGSYYEYGRSSAWLKLKPAGVD